MIKHIQINDQIFKNLQWLDIAVDPLKDTPFKIHKSTDLCIKVNNTLLKVKKTFIISSQHQRIKSFMYYTDTYILVCKTTNYGIHAVYDISSNTLFIQSLCTLSDTQYIKSALNTFLRLKKKYKNEFTKSLLIEPAKQILCTSITKLQIMHNLMQDLSGVYDTLEKFDIKYVFSFYEYYGQHEFIFKTCKHINNTKFIRNITNEELFIKTCNENLYHIKNLGSVAHKQLLTNITEYLYLLPVNNELIDSIYKDTQHKNKCVLFTIRTVNRTPTNQVEFIAKSIKSIASIHPNITFLLDGNTELYNNSKYQRIHQYQDEIDVANKIIKQCKGIKVYNLIGETISTYIQCIKYLLLYVSHIGTLQHKIGLFTDSKGLVHGGPQKMQGDWQSTFYFKNHFGKKVQKFKDGCIDYPNQTYNCNYTIDIKKSCDFLIDFLKNI